MYLTAYFSLDQKEEEGEVEDTSKPNKGNRQKKTDEEQEDEDFDDIGTSNDECDDDSEAEGN